MGKHEHKEKHKKLHKEKKKHKKHDRKKYSSSSSSSEDEWVEKGASSSVREEKPAKIKELKRPEDDWDLFASVIPATSRPDRKTERDEAKRKEREANQYDPSKCSRELNPYWKDGGDGLPSAKFLKPSDNKDSQETYKKKSFGYNPSQASSNWRKRSSSEKEHSSKYVDPSEENRKHSNSNWRKKSDSEHYSKSRNSHSESHKSYVNKESANEQQDVPSTSTKYTEPSEKPAILSLDEEVLSDKQMNELAAKVVKAEIMGNDELAAKLKDKLDRARHCKKQETSDKHVEDVILTRTDSKGFSRPVSSSYSESDKYGGRKSNKKKKVETHDAGDRVRYFPDDDKHSLREMFENEKFNTSAQQEAEFVEMAGKVSKYDDMDDSYVDKIRDKRPSDRTDRRAKDSAIREHQKTTKSLDACARCLQSQQMDKHLMIALGQTAHLSLPAHEPLTEGHCLIVPNRHAPCGTQLDENEWEDVMNMRKALTRMFAAQGEDVIFFEVATGLHRLPHMALECVPVPKEDGDLAPIYFKKAIDECEMEWATNKKLVSLAGRDVRRAVPKGLSYFCVSFGMDEGYAHVIEDQQLFPGNFAQEIIGGMLDIEHSKWRKPKREQFDAQKERVLQFSKMWKEYDCTSN